MLLEAKEQLVWGEFREGLELTLHPEVKQDPKELQEDLLGDKVSKRARGRKEWGGQPVTCSLLSPDESIHLFI